MSFRCALAWIAMVLPACETTPVPPAHQSSALGPQPSTRTARVEPALPSATASSSATPAASSVSAAATASTAAPVRPSRAPGELPGKTIDYVYDAKDVGDRSRAWEGRAFVHDAAIGAQGPLPLVVFFHGLNRELLPHRWMGGGNEGDVRRVASDLIDAGTVPPFVLAGPGSVERAAVAGGASFPVFDFDRFLELTEAALDGVARIDRARIVVTGHSGAGCSDAGGIVAAVRAKTQPFAVLSIDTCMAVSLATALGRAPPETHVVVTWQTASWPRGFDRFRSVFAREVASHPPAPGVLRELDALPALPRAHDATVKQTFDKWLPRILGAAR